MLLTLTSDGDLFAAALSQTTVSVWQTDEHGVYSEVDRGIIEEFTRISIRMSTISDEIAFYFRDDGTLFRAET
ncbi:hypothetical protein [Paenibacillus qinlingensis]|uniref:Protocatechuate 3,4-dioxygenase beta subunit n=1 Tax=Paenibacillus qinlingensis TaxID=1837343 RepID=A0ABU1NR38_9BACL|nr:hypothetical protein [Paenibacillus qinlingensis]MDR6549946.1 protocatechuate 3,4-dioxygenase beta subunit [Paenibacillus qinlingensis]